MKKQFIITLTEYIIHKRASLYKLAFLFYRNIDVISHNSVIFPFKSCSLYCTGAFGLNTQFRYDELVNIN